MADQRSSLGLRWFFLLLVAEIALFAVIYYLRNTGAERPGDAPLPEFSQVQRLNLQSLINAKGYPCPRPPALHYEQRHSRGVVIVAICAEADGAAERFEIDFKGHVHKL